MNRSIESGIHPLKLKLAKVVPVFKSEDEWDPNNYRPISLLSLFNRVFEKLMYLDKHNLLYQCHYGFQEKCSHSMLLLILLIEFSLILTGSFSPVVYL